MYEVAHLQEELSTKDSKIDELSQILDNERKEHQKSTARNWELTSTASSLRKDVHRYKSRCDRAKETRSHAIEKAVEKTRKEFKSAGTKRVKRPDGRIEDWVRHLVVELVALDGVPTAKVPQVIERVRHEFFPNDDDQAGVGARNQTISDRSVRRMLAESYIKAFLRAAQLLKEAPCQCRTCIAQHTRN